MDNDFDFEEDDSWYEDAMNEMDSPLNNHSRIYQEDEISHLDPVAQSIVRARNEILEQGFEYMDLQMGDYLNEVVYFSATIHIKQAAFYLTFQKENAYIFLFSHITENEEESGPLQKALIYTTNKHLGAFQFVHFFHLNEPLAEDQKTFGALSVNRKLQYRNEPSLEIYKSDDILMNEEYIHLIDPFEPKVFEFYNEFIITQINEPNGIKDYLRLIEVLDQKNG